MNILVIKNKGGNLMKKLAGVLGALALALTSAASVGCVVFLIDEPTALEKLKD